MGIAWKDRTVAMVTGCPPFAICTTAKRNYSTEKLSAMLTLKAVMIK